MDNREMQVEEVKLSSLLLFVVSKWKSILIFGFIGLVLGLGVGLFTSSQSSNQEVGAEDEYEKSEQEKFLEKYEFQKKLYHDAIEKVESLEKYVINSKLMEMDSYEVYRGTLTYVIQCDYEEMERVRVELRSFIWDGEFMDSLEKMEVFSKDDLESVVSLATTDENGSAELLLYQENGKGESQIVVVNPNTTGHINIRIAIMAQEEVDATKLVKAMQTSLGNCFDNLRAKGLIGEDILVNEKIEFTRSAALATYQANQISNYKSAISTRDAYEATLDSLKLQMVAIPTIESNRMLSGIIGIVFAMVLAVLIWVFVYILSGKLYSVSDKATIIGTNQLATIHNFGKKKGIDLWLAQKLGGIYSELPLEEQRKVALLNIENAMEKIGSVKKLFVVSTQGDTLPEAQLLIEQLKADGYVVEGCENVIGRADVIQRVAQCDAALIIEDNQKSKTALVKEEVNILNNYMSNVLGMVVVEG